jgi:hypothetical protein
MNHSLLEIGESNGNGLFSIAMTAGIITAIIEYPISHYYSTIPPTNTAKRMAIAGGMAFVATLVGGAVLKQLKK